MKRQPWRVVEGRVRNGLALLRARLERDAVDRETLEELRLKVESLQRRANRRAP